MDKEKLPLLWERQEWETPTAWNYFVIYRDLGVNRSLEEALKVIGNPKMTKRHLERYSKKGNWVYRCREYDAYCDRLLRRDNEERMRKDYKKKADQYWSDRNQLARADLGIVIKIHRLAQQKLDYYTDHPDQLRGGELGALLRICRELHQWQDISMKEILAHEAPGQQGVQAIEEISFDSVDPAELLAQHQRLLDELAAN